MSISLHPLLDSGLKKGSETFPGGNLYCKCPSNKVTVTLSSNVLHNHACGCTKCWKPAGALFSIVGVVPRNAVSITSNNQKLSIIDKTAAIQRYACKECGVHMFGRIESDEHPFKGLDFVHVELSDVKEGAWQEPQFAGFVSSIIEQGFDPRKMEEIRGRFEGLGLRTYDALSPPLMDLIATSAAKKSGALSANL